MNSPLCQLEWLLLACLLLFQLQSCLSVPPTLRSSIDGYKAVCPGEKVHFTCSVLDSNSLTWKSTEYIGRNTVIEFNRNFDRLGVGKSTSLPNRETTLLQLASVTDRELEATLRIVIVDSVGNASVECANDIPESKQQTLLLADSAPEAPGLRLKTTNVAFYDYISLSAPPSSDRVDIDFYKATAVGYSFNDTFVLSKDTSKFAIPLLYDQFSQNVTLEVVAVDRCGRESPGAMISIPANVNMTSLPTNCKNEIMTCLPPYCVNSAARSHCQVHTVTFYLLLAIHLYIILMSIMRPILSM